LVFAVPPPIFERFLSGGWYRAARSNSALVIKDPTMMNTMISNRRAADDRGLAPTPLRCPLCGSRLSEDTWWKSVHFICPLGHSYSNVRTLIAELGERGWLPASFRIEDTSDDAEILNELERAMREYDAR
jgi:hypothetical protein